jgi:hypothetical protein
MELCISWLCLVSGFASAPDNNSMNFDTAGAESVERSKTLRPLHIMRRLRPARKISGWIRMIIWRADNVGLDGLVFPFWYTITRLPHYAF